MYYQFCCSQGGMLKRKDGHDLSHNCLSTMSEALQGLAVEPDDMEDIKPLQLASRVTPSQETEPSQFCRTTSGDSGMK